MTFIGIDPGKLGCFAAIDSDGALLEWHRCPTFGTRGKGVEYDVLGMAFRLQLLISKYGIDDFGDGVVIAIENPGKVTRIGGRTIHATDLREGFRLWHGIVAGLMSRYPSIRVLLVTPQQWQKRMHASTPATLERKDRSVMAAGMRWPALDMTPGKRRKADPDIAEAHLIAEWARTENMVTDGGGNP